MLLEVAAAAVAPWFVWPTGAAVVATAPTATSVVLEQSCWRWLLCHQITPRYAPWQGHQAGDVVAGVEHDQDRQVAVRPVPSREQRSPTSRSCAAVTAISSSPGPSRTASSSEGQHHSPVARARQRQADQHPTQPHFIQPAVVQGAIQTTVPEPVLGRSADHGRAINVKLRGRPTSP
ncbi:hypothetical protein ACNFR7_04910 [Streptomyces sp. RM1]